MGVAKVPKLVKGARLKILCVCFVGSNPTLGIFCYFFTCVYLRKSFTVIWQGGQVSVLGDLLSDRRDQLVRLPHPKPQQPSKERREHVQAHIPPYEGRPTAKSLQVSTWDQLAWSHHKGGQ